MSHVTAAQMADTVSQFTGLLNQPEVTEGEVQSFMEAHTEIIPLPSLLGHELHAGCVISKFELDRCRIPDFAYLTKNTAHWRLVAVELERPQKPIFTKSPRAKFHSETDEALSQIADWKLHVAAHVEDIRRKLAPLLMPEYFRDNLIEVKYVLIIGRDPTPPFTTEQKGRLLHLQRENDITLLTYDSLIRMSAQGNCGIGRLKNVLIHHRNAFRMKYANVDHTDIFAWNTPSQIELSEDQIRWYRERGYDMDAWLRGEMLTINQRLPSSREGEVWDAIATARVAAPTRPARGTLEPPDARGS